MHIFEPKMHLGFMDKIQMTRVYKNQAADEVALFKELFYFYINAKCLYI
jgi:hypothetical protein